MRASDKRKLLVALAIHVCKMLMAVFKVELNIKKNNLLKNAKDKVGSMPEAKKQLLKTLAMGNGGSISGTKESFRRNASDKERDDDALVTAAGVDQELEGYFEEILSEDFCLDIASDKSVLNFLISFSLVDDNGLTKTAIETIHVIHSQFEGIKNCVQRLLFIDKRNEEHYHKIVDLSKRLTHLSESAEKWFLTPRISEQETLRHTINELNRFLTNKKIFLDPEAEMAVIDKSDVSTVSVPAVLHPVFTHVIHTKFVTSNSFFQELYRHLKIIDRKPL